MNPEIKKLWVEALRSGRYTQGKGYLRSDGAYCCLGVLCEIAVSALVIDAPVECGPLHRYDGNSSYLPETVGEWAELSPADHQVKRLMFQNDSGSSFEVIAQLIEERL